MPLNTSEYLSSLSILINVRAERYFLILFLFNLINYILISLKSFNNARRKTHAISISIFLRNVLIKILI